MTTDSKCVTVSLDPSMDSQFRDWPGSIVGAGRGIIYRISRSSDFIWRRGSVHTDYGFQKPPRTGREEETVPSIGTSHLQGRSFPEGGTSPQEKVKSRR